VGESGECVSRRRAQDGAESASASASAERARRSAPSLPLKSISSTVSLVTVLVEKDMPFAPLTAPL
jgi:hypothetical protein